MKKQHYNIKIAELFRDSTIPAGLIQIVPGTGETVGTQLATHKDIQLVSLTVVWAQVKLYLKMRLTALKT